MSKIIIAILLLLPLRVSAQTDSEMLGRALDYVAGEKWHEALVIFDRLDARYRLNARYRAYMGLCLYHEWDYRRAATVLGESLPQLGGLAPHERSVYLYAAAESHFQLAAYDSARVYFEADLRLCYDNERGDVLYRIGLCHMQQEHWAAADSAYDEADRWLAAHRTGPDVAARRAQIAHMRRGCQDRLDTIYIKEQSERGPWQSAVACAVVVLRRQDSGARP